MFQKMDFPSQQSLKKYSLHYKKKGWLKTSTLDPETVIFRLSLTEQDHVSYQVTDKFNKL
jgi:hypothetical protein